MLLLPDIGNIVLDRLAGYEGGEAGQRDDDPDHTGCKPHRRECGLRLAIESMKEWRITKVGKDFDVEQYPTLEEMQLSKVKSCGEIVVRQGV